jgi:hypothetical protein
VASLGGHPSSKLAFATLWYRDIVGVYRTNESWGMRYFERNSQKGKSLTDTSDMGPRQPVFAGVSGARRA